MILTIESRRRDGKFKVIMSWPGSPNAFGGLNFTHSIRKWITLEGLENEIGQAKEVYDPCNLLIPRANKIKLSDVRVGSQYLVTELGDRRVYTVKSIEDEMVELAYIEDGVEIEGGVIEYRLLTKAGGTGARK